MPHIGAAMERTLMPQRSLIDSALDLVARSVTAAMVKRDAVGDAKQQVTDVKTAFSSWDNCMQASFCKCVASSLFFAPVAQAATFHYSITYADPRQVARHWHYDFCGLDCYLCRLVLHTLSMLWCFLLLQVFLLPEMLWKLLRLLRLASAT